MYETAWVPEHTLEEGNSKTHKKNDKGKKKQEIDETTIYSPPIWQRVQLPHGRPQSSDSEYAMNASVTTT